MWVFKPRDIPELKSDDFIIIQQASSNRTYKSSISDVFGGALISNPPLGKRRITNLYFDPITNKVVIEYNDEP